MGESYPIDDRENRERSHTVAIPEGDKVFYEMAARLTLSSVEELGPAPLEGHISIRVTTRNSQGNSQEFYEALEQIGY